MDKKFSRLIFLLVVLFTLSVADIVTTYVAIGLGAEEFNPIMDYVISQGWVVAFMFKIVVTAVACVLMWKGRRSRSILKTAVFINSIVAIVVINNIIVLLFLL